MAEGWIVRVQGKEYGPVDLETLREWQRDGRVVPDNDVRKSGDSEWSKAATMKELFPPPLPDVVPASSPRRPRSLGEIAIETFHIYRKGFATFFSLALLVAIPGCVLKISLAYFNFSEQGLPTTQILAPRVVAIIAIAALVALWPIFLSGIQIATADLAAGQSISLRDVLRRAARFWPVVAKLCLLVYGSYFVWSVIPLLAIFSLVAAQPSGFSILLAFVILALQVYMTARLFVNFLFWQQSSVLAGLNTLDALRESKELAHTRPQAPRLERPLYRGAIIASLWLLLLVVFSSGAEVPFVMMRIQGITNIQEATALVQKLANASAPDSITLATYVMTSLIQALLRPLLGIAFVILYLDTKRDISPT